MHLKSQFFAAAVIACGLSLSTRAQSEPGHAPKGAEKAFNEYAKIEIKNFQDESLGRIKDLGVDLVNGRIVEVLVVSDSALGVGNKIVAVPPLALTADPLNKVYRLNVSREVFKTAAAIDLAKWDDAGRSDRVAASYHLFGQEPYFLEEGDTASRTAERPKVPLGYVERCNKLVEMPVGNFQGHEFGRVWSLTLDIPQGRILNVIVLAPGNFKTKSIIPAMALSFNAQRDALLLNDTKAEYADEPRFLFTEASLGNEAYSHEESFKGPHTSGPLVQGSSYRDIDRTVQIYRDIRAAKVNGRHVEVATNNGRVTLRGWTYTAEEQQQIGAIAIAASRLELVDNQITVGKTSASK